jgi:MYXO-CTERM domain-containing protein
MSWLALLTPIAWGLDPHALPGDDAVGPAAGTQDQPALAEGDGSTWLLVWRDTRASLAGTLGSDATDVWSTRLDADGAPLEPVSSPVASGPWSESAPRVAWNGADWLVAYNADAATPAYWSQGVWARRVGSDGVLIDVAPIPLVDAEFEDEALWDVASDGTAWAVLWQGVDRTVGSFVLDGATVDAGGVPSAGQRVYTPGSSVSAPWNARLAWSTDRYLAVWDAWGDDNDVEALPLDAALAPLGPVFDVVGDASSSVNPAIAASDDGFYVGWYDDTFGAVWGTVRGTPVTGDGVVGVAGGTSVSEDAWPLDVRPDVAWMEGTWGVGWEFGAGAAISASLVDPAGDLVQRAIVSGPLGTTVRPAAAGGADRMLLGWADLADGGTFDLRGLAVSSDGTAGSIRDLALSAPAQTRPALAGGEDGWLIVTQSETSGDSAILAWRTDGGGYALDAGPIELARGEGLSEPAVAWNGSVWLVVWADRFDGVVGVRVDPSGFLLDPEPVPFLSGTAPAVGASGDTFLVAGVVPVTFDTNQLLARRVDESGLWLDATPLALGTNYAEEPDVSALGDGFVVSWVHRFSHDSGLRDAMYTVVSDRGAVRGQTGIRTSGSVALESGVDVATDGTGALLVWSDAGDVRGRFLDAAGQLLGDGAGFVVSDAANTQFDPDVAWDGATYHVAWTDWRIHPGLEPGEGDVYTTPVDPSGVVGDPAGIPVGVEPVPEGNAAVGGVNGERVLVWTELVDEAPFGAFRLRVSGPPQEPPEQHTGHTGLPEDTGSLPHSALAHTGAPDDTDVDPPKEPDGCGCATGGTLPPLVPAGLALLVLRRRRR